MDNYPPHPKPPVAVPGECPWRQSAFVPRCPFVVPGRNFACQSRLVSCRPRHTLHLPLTLPLAAGKFVSAATRSGRSSRHRRRSHRSPYGRFPGALWYFLAKKKVHTPKHSQKKRSLSAPPFICPPSEGRREANYECSNLSILPFSLNF